MKIYKRIDGNDTFYQFIQDNEIMYLRKSDKAMGISTYYDSFEHFLHDLEFGHLEQTNLTLQDIQFKPIVVGSYTVENITTDTIDVGCCKGIKRETIEKILDRMNQVK